MTGCRYYCGELTYKIRQSLAPSQMESHYMPEPANQQESLREVVEAALEAEAATVHLPSMLIAIWQLTQCVLLASQCTPNVGLLKQYALAWQHSLIL